MTENHILEVENLVKKYNKKTVINHLNLKVKKGEIYALLGRNGAGKTTTMGIIIQLIKKDEGTVKILGQDIQENKKLYKKIGVQIDYPGFYPNLTGYENLKYFQTLKKAGDNKNIENILKIIGLYKDKDKQAKNYSMGMKQRLAIAVALLDKPELLILDEPINGLDPQGIIDMRKFLKTLSKEYGITILISSHILSEIEQIADTIGIMDRGSLIEELKIEDIKKQLYQHTKIETDNTENAVKILKTTGTDFRTEGGHVLIRQKKDVPEVIEKLTKNNIKIYSAIPVVKDLEEYFINKTSHKPENTQTEDDLVCLT